MINNTCLSSICYSLFRGSQRLFQTSQNHLTTCPAWQVSSGNYVGACYRYHTYEGSPITLTLFLILSPRIIMLCYCSSKMTKDHFFEKFIDTTWPLSADVPLNPHSLAETGLQCLPWVPFGSWSSSMWSCCISSWSSTMK